LAKAFDVVIHGDAKSPKITMKALLDKHKKGEHGTLAM
jgi:hypothetical protein